MWKRALLVFYSILERAYIFKPILKSLINMNSHEAIKGEKTISEIASNNHADEKISSRYLQKHRLKY